MVWSLLLLVSDKSRLVKHNSTSGRSVFQTCCSKVFDVAVTQKENVSLCLLTFLDGFSVKAVNGMLYNPLTRSWSWIESTSINYALHAVKSEGQAQTSQTEPLSEMKSEQCSATAGTSVWPAEIHADGLPPGTEKVLDRHNKAFCNNKLAVCINNVDAIFGQIFWAVSEKTSACYLRNPLRLKSAKLWKKSFYKKRSFKLFPQREGSFFGWWCLCHLRKTCLSVEW